MELIAKFYSHYRDSNIIQQIEVTSIVNIKQEINNFGIADFTIPIFDGIIEDAKVELYEVGSNADKLIFSGFVYEIKPVWGQFSMVQVSLRSDKAIFYKRKALKNYSYENKSLKEVIKSLMQIYNDEYNEHWDVDVNLDEKITMEINL